MRLFRLLTLMISLVTPTAFAADLLWVEMILVRQNAVPAIVSRAAPEDWPPAHSPSAPTACARRASMAK